MVAEPDVVTDPDVPEFDHRVAGTPESRWADSPALLRPGVLDLSGVRRLIVVAAHPDDESLGAGGLLAAATRLGIGVTVVIATMGEHSHPDSRTRTPSELASIRRAEVVAALEFLAPTATVKLLGLPDGDLSAHQDELARSIGRFIEDEPTLLASPWIADGHPDHTAAGIAAADAAGERNVLFLQYPIWFWHWSSPPEMPTSAVRLDLTPVDLDAKLAALQCHRSQIEPLSDLPGDEEILPRAVAEHFERTYEIFITPDTEMSPTDQHSLPKEFFDEFYGDQDDPWGFESRWYETRKRTITMASLPRESFRTAFEPGCSIGVLTAELAGRCDRLLATDISDRPLAAARRRLADMPGVRFEQRRIPAEWPREKFDLIVLSEVGYYCGAADLAIMAARAASSLTPDGVLLACHWRYPVAEYPLSGDDVHRALAAEPGLALLAEHLEEDFILQVFTPPPAVSVATANGLR